MTGALLAQVPQPPVTPPPTGDGPLQLPSVEYWVLAPWLALVVGAVLLLLVSSLTVRKGTHSVYALWTVLTGVVGLGAAMNAWDRIAEDGPTTAVAGAVAVDGFSIFFAVAILIAVILGALVADSYLDRERLQGPEFYVLAMLSAAGGILMATANDLLLLFLGLEILSISLYVLAGFHQRRQSSREAAIKYFVLGSFSSAIFLYGIALVYGATGSTNMVGIATFLAGNVLTANGVLLAGMALLLVGFGFKVAAVPFHVWTPDVYQGSPTPVTGFMAASAKAAGFAGLLRVFMSALQTQRVDWQPLIWVLAVLTLVVGSVLAVVQTDVKRMLAYSSISHAGYILVGLQAASDAGVAGALFYVLAYTFMVLGTFAVITVVGRTGDSEHALESWRGLATRRPGLAFAMTVLLAAQAGVPLTTGFLGKFYVIAAAVEERSYALALIAMLAAAIAAFFYLRLVVLMYSPLEGDEPTPADGKRRYPIRLTMGVALAVTVGFTVVFGAFPDPIVDFAKDATLLF